MPTHLPTLRKPTAAAIRAFLDGQARMEPTYAETATPADEPPPGFRAIRARADLGRGARAFDAARAVLLGWEQFPRGWAEPCFPDVPIEPGRVVAVLARGLGAWWLNACRIVTVVDEEGPGGCFGFAVATLPGHVATGEERFLVQWNPADDSVWYDLSSFSRPRGWLAIPGAPYLRRTQKRFARDSIVAMRRAVALRS